jgi:hypothetical protein
LYGIALATEVWGVIASLLMSPPFVGAGVSAGTLVIAFSFAVSRPCLTLKVCTFVRVKLEFVIRLNNICSCSLCEILISSNNLFLKKINQMMEEAVHFLSKDTVVQAMSRSANKVSLLYICIKKDEQFHSSENWLM